MRVLAASHTKWTFLALGLVAICVGCTSGMSEYVPTWIVPENEKTSYLTPNKRIEKLASLREKISGKDAAEQDRIANELALQIQSEEDPIMRAEIVRTLSKFKKSPKAAAVLRAALKDNDPDIRVMACDLLAGQGGADVVPQLSEVLQSDTNIDVRLAATRGLSRSKSPSVVPALAIALEDPDPALQYRAVESLRKSTGRDFGNDVNAWRQFARGELPTTDRSPTVAERVKGLNPF